MTGMILADTRWRIEVYKKGRYWGWRRGSGKEGQYRYGGKFETLSSQRQAAYLKRTGTGDPAAVAAEIRAGRHPGSLSQNDGGVLIRLAGVQILDGHLLQADEE